MTIEALLSVKDVMRHLGVSESFVRKLLQRRQLPFVKLSGGVVRVRLVDLQAWLASRTIQRERV
jgi:excisionase family DNA binding protein